MGTVTVKMGDVSLASHILLAIFENLRRENNKRQLFMKVTCNDLQDIFYELLVNFRVQYWSGGLFFKFAYLKNLFIFSGPIPFCPILPEAIQQLQLAGMVCWPDAQEPDLMRLNPSATIMKQYCCVIPIED